MALKASPRRSLGSSCLPYSYKRGGEKEDGPSVLSLFRASSILGSGVMADTALPANLQRDGLRRSTLPFLGCGGVGQAGLHS